ncbi:peptidoglycan-binding protein [Caulobacter mirabilis]|uniref:Localization factor PodJS n=1 Tax=Caulobacter mirabilis TaxID=69666 RepID=A0A2D2B053_9CAUL|nr:peptidoglycan-binding protein [Caulobacter mirabilis]ATQ43624.1 Localization factor PodJS [Caulobacter mirabilis]
MTAGAPWSVKGIDPKAREIAKDLARRSGMTLGEWLNRMIVEGEAPASPDTAHDHAFDSPDEPIAIAMPGRGGGSRYEVPGHPADEVGRIAEAMERLTQRIEAAEQRSTLAISGIDQSVRGALSRLENTERDQVAIASRFEGAIGDLRTEHETADERLRRMERDAAGPRSAEALRALEGMMGKVASQFYESEGRTRDALVGVEGRLAQIEKSDPANLVDAVAIRVAERLEQAEARTTSALRDMGASFVALDRRLKAVEAGSGGAERLESLALDLTRRLEATRADLSEKLAASAEARFDRMDRRLSEMAQHIGAAETRSAEAIERMGREMVNMADSFSRKVQGVEHRGADAVEQIGGEVARIAAAVEQKLSRADTVQAQALEKLGGEIARITERLSERIANSERRGALAIDEIGEQVARVTERIGQRQERSATDLAERIRQSEERTARLLEEAREKIDASLNSNHRRLVEQVTPPAAVAAAQPSVQAPPLRDPFATDPFAAPVRGFAEEAYAPQAFAQMPPPEARPEPTPAAAAQPAPFPAPERAEPAFSQEDFDAADGFDPIDEFETVDAGPVIPDAPEVPAAPVITPPPVEDFAQPRSTREVIEQARMAARAASAPDKAAPQARRGLFGGGEKKAKRRAGGSSLQSWVVLLAGTATAVGVGGFGYLVWKDSLGVGGPASARVAAMAKVTEADAKGEIKTGEADTTPTLPTSPRLAVAIAPGLTPTPSAAAPAPALAGAPSAPAPAATTPPPQPAPTETPASLYAEGVRRIEAKDSTGLETLRRAANLGYAPAQFYLSKLYENGEGGVRKNEGEARRWTERAAQGGDPKAMHNLGLAYFHGTGGPTNKTSAAQWFRRAADLGMGDSQYNLASLYEQGYGVSQNAAEAYKWYLIAARQGDAEARQSAERVKKALSPEARAAAERSATGFRSSVRNASTRAPAVAEGGSSVLSAQRGLSVLGYYRGPQDGVSSQALKGAIQAFQRDKRLPATGNLDAETLSQLSIYAR